jgi:D-alanyl-D-alanine carboxypeptidase
VSFRSRSDGVGRSARRALWGLLVVMFALLFEAGLHPPGESAALLPAAGSSHVNLQRELRGLVTVPGGPPGAIAIIERPGSSAVYRAGVSDARTRASLDTRLSMRLASVSKAFAGAVALALVDRHVLSLSDTIAKRLPQLPASWGAVTLAQALNHTSGLPDFSQNDGFVEYLRSHPRATPPPLFLLRFVAHDGLAFTPGTRYRYSNTDNFVVALMTEAATHRSYTALLQSMVFAPLHLKSTSLPTGPSLPRPYLHGYAPDPPKPPEDVSTLVSGAYSWASGGMISTAADLNRFIRGYLGRRLFGRVVQHEQLRFIPGSSGPPGPGKNFAGLAIFRYQTSCGTVYGHTGNTLGYTQFVASTLDGKRSVTLSVNAQLSDESPKPILSAYRRLRQIEQDMVCAALR